MFLTCLTLSLLFLFQVIVSISRIELPTKICFKIGVKKIAHSKQIFVRRKWCKVKAQFLNYQIFLNFFQKKFKSHSLVTENDVWFSFCDCKGRVFFWTGKIKSDFFWKKTKKSGKTTSTHIIIYKGGAKHGILSQSGWQGFLRSWGVRDIYHGWHTTTQQ